MRRTLFAALAFVIAFGAAILLPLSSAHAVEVFSAETETRIYNPAKSYGGYFMPSNMGSMMGTPAPTVYLMDMMGYVVHQWPGVNGWAPQLSEDGTLWSNGYIYDWDGALLWDYNPARDAPGRYPTAFSMHHDGRKMWNKKLQKYTMLIVANRNLTQAEMVAMGADPGIDYTKPPAGAVAGPFGPPSGRNAAYDFIIEVDMNKNIVWEWSFKDHAVQSKNPALPNYISDVKNAPGRFDINWWTDNERPGGTPGLVYDWAHVNSVDYNEDLDHIVVNPKHFSDFFVIDHGKTFVSTTDFSKNTAAAAGPDGDVIYRFGNPSSYNAGNPPGWMTEGDSQMYGSHNIQWIRPYHWGIPHLATDTWPDPRTYTRSGIALPGAGNFLIFDNGCYNPTGMRSRILEINPRIGASGNVEAPVGKYIWPVVAGYKSNSATYKPSKQVAWSYQAGLQSSFYSSFISGMQRLPNGNTSIHSGNTAHMFEVTPSGEVVWEYIYPGVAGSAAAIQSDPGAAAGIGNAVYRHYRYGADFPAFAGKNLTPVGTLTGLQPRLVAADRIQQTPTYGFGFGSALGGGGGGGAGAGSAGGGGGY